MDKTAPCTLRSALLSRLVGADTEVQILQNKNLAGTILLGSRGVGESHTTSVKVHCFT